MSPYQAHAIGRSPMATRASGFLRAALSALCLALLCAVARAGEPPQLHSVEWVGSPADRTLSVQGEFAAKPKVRVGGRRARVKNWSATSLTVKVSRRVDPGFHALEAETRAGEAFPPLGVHNPGRVRSLKKMQFRKKRDRPQRFQKPDLSLDDPEPGMVSIAFSRRDSYRYKVKTCTSFRFCIFGECTDRCNTRPAYGSLFWYVGLYVPHEAIALGPPHVCTSADEGALIGYADPRNVYSTSSSENDRWWIVVGRDADGVISGQYSGVVQNSKGRKFRVSGRFALPLGT